MPKKVQPKTEELEDEIKLPVADLTGDDEVLTEEEDDEDGAMSTEDVNPFGDRWEE